MDIIRYLFNEVYSLEEWISSIDINKELDNRLISPDDSKGYIQFMKTTVVALSQNAKKLSLPVTSFKQMSYQREVIIRVIERIRRHEGTGKNILTFGFGPMSDNPDAQISSTPNIEYRYPNSIINRLHYGVWNKLLTRIGDTVMEYLLEHTFVFMFVPPSCYIQITGKPLYELWPYQSSVKMLVNPSSHKSPTNCSKNKLQKTFGNTKKKKHQSYKEQPEFQGRFTVLRNKHLQDHEQQTIKHPCVQGVHSSKHSYDHSTELACDQVGHFIKLPSDQDKLSVKVLSDQEEQSCAIISKELNIYQEQKETILSQNETFRRSQKRKFDKKDSACSPKSKRSRKDVSSINDKTVIVCEYEQLTCHKSFGATKAQEMNIDKEMSNQTIDHTMEEDQAVAMEVQAVAIDTDSEKKCQGAINEMYKESKDEICHVKNMRKKCKKRKKKSKIQDFTPFIFHTYFTRISMLYSKVLCERLQRTFKWKDSRELYTEIFCSEDICGDLKTKIHVKAENFTRISDKDSTSKIHQQPMSESVRFKEHGVCPHAPISENVTNCTKDNTLFMNQQKIGESLTNKNPSQPSTNTDLKQNTLTVDGQICETSHLSDNGFQAESRKDSHCASESIKSLEVRTVGSILDDHRSEIKSGVQIDFIPELIPILDSFLNKCQKCPYKALLNRHCNSMADIQKRKQTNMKSSSEQTQIFHKLKGSRHVVPIFRRRDMKVKTLSYRCSAVHGPMDGFKNKSPSVRHLLSEYIPHRQVYLFLRLVCLLVVPDKLWGLRQNRNIFFKNIEKMVCMGKYDKFCLGQLMKGVKTKGVDWLKGVKSNCSKVHMLAKLWYWLMKHFIMVILKSFFYITETTQHRNRLFYYRKKTWNLLHSSGLYELKQKQILKPLAQVETKEVSMKSLGIASLRFLPKKKSLRPIINLGQQPSQSLKQTLPINKQLLNLHHVITFIKNEWPHLLGSAKFGTNEIFTSWKTFKLKWEMKRKPLYFVKTDVINCFDNIRQEKLYNIIEDIFKQFGCEEFVVRKFASVYQAVGHLKRTFHRKVLKMMDYNPDFFLYIKEVSSKYKFRNAIIIDQVVNQHERTENLLQQLKSHLLYNVIKIGKQYYRQSQGISQGSILSTLLCNLYYGHMEKQMFSFQEEELLMRVVDDFLFVTPDKDRAVDFLNKMAAGNAEYNCHVNADKMLVNFQFVHEKFGEIPFLKDTDWFPWCGMLFNTSTLSVSIDFSRYSGIFVGDTMTYDLACKPGQSMKNKLMFSLRSKCHSLFLDSELNQEDVLITNCYKLFLITTFKFHVYATKLPYKQRTENNPGFFLDMIVELVNFFYSQTNVSRGSKVARVFILDKDTLQWLFVRAFTIKLQKHHSQYNRLLKLLKILLSGLERKLHRKDIGLCDKLRQLCKDLPADFEDVL